MKWLIFLLGAIVAIFGAIPLLYNIGFLPVFLEFIPREGIFYNIIILVLGGIISYTGLYLRG